MAAKKKNKKKQSSTKKSTATKRKPAKKQAARKPISKKKAPKKAVRKPVAQKSIAPRKKPTSVKSAGSLKKRAGKRAPLDNVVAFQRGDSRVSSGGQSGDLQGLSGSARSNSESVDELLEEGNAFEAEVVAGVERADDADEEEVHTHEVAEDDVPGEYLDKD